MCINMCLSSSSDTYYSLFTSLIDHTIVGLSEYPLQTSEAIGFVDVCINVTFGPVLIPNPITVSTFTGSGKLILILLPKYQSAIDNQVLWRWSLEDVQ